MSMTPPSIIIADDDEGHRILIEENIRHSGLKNPVFCLRDGREVLDFLNGLHPRHRFDAASPCILVMDVRMPRMDGMETLRRIKTDARFKRLPVVILTTADDPREVARAYDLGCSLYLTKPVDYTRFIEVVRQLGAIVSLLKLPALNDSAAA